MHCPRTSPFVRKPQPKLLSLQILKPCFFSVWKLQALGSRLSVLISRPKPFDSSEEALSNWEKKFERLISAVAVSSIGAACGLDLRQHFCCFLASVYFEYSTRFWFNHFSTPMNIGKRSNLRIAKSFSSQKMQQIFKINNNRHPWIWAVQDTRGNGSEERKIQRRFGFNNRWKDRYDHIFPCYQLICSIRCFTSSIGTPIF